MTHIKFHFSKLCRNPVMEHHLFLHKKKKKEWHFAANINMTETSLCYSCANDLRFLMIPDWFSWDFESVSKSRLKCIYFFFFFFFSKSYFTTNFYMCTLTHQNMVSRGTHSGPKPLIRLKLHLLSISILPVICDGNDRGMGKEEKWRKEGVEIQVSQLIRFIRLSSCPL